MYLVAVLLVLIGLTLSAGNLAERLGRGDTQPQAIEITCTDAGAEVVKGAGVARPDGVLVRFAHQPGQWSMAWEGAPGHSVSSGSAHTAEFLWPLPPGRARVHCHPTDLPSERDAYNEPQWWVEVEVTDPAGHFGRPALACSSQVGSSWHGEDVKAGNEEQVVWDALAMLGLMRDDTDRLAPSGYPDGVPRTWIVWREGKAIAEVQMQLDPEGRILPATMSACDHVVTRRGS